MKAHGTAGITGAGSVPVEGEVWFDHQWGNFEASRLAWNWFALQLDDGSSVMLYQLFDKASKALALAGTHRRGWAQRALDEKAVSLTPEGCGEAPNPAFATRGVEAWLPQGEVELKPLRQDSEFSSLETTFAHYWEGGVAVSGALGGRRLRGDERLRPCAAGAARGQRPEAFFAPYGNRAVAHSRHRAQVQP